MPSTPVVVRILGQTAQLGRPLDIPLLPSSGLDDDRGVSERLGPDALPASIWVQVAEQSPELALIVDDDSRCWFASMTLQRVTGFAQDEVIGEPLVELVHPEDRDRLEQAVVAVSLDR